VGSGYFGSIEALPFPDASFDAVTRVQHLPDAVYSDSSCSSQVASGGTKTVINGSVPNSDPVTFNSAGPCYWQAVYSGDANNDGATGACTSEQLVVINPQVSQILPTSTTCQPFLTGVPSLLQVQYSLKDNVINQVSPGVFFYFVKVNVSSPGPESFTISSLPVVAFVDMTLLRFGHA